MKRLLIVWMWVAVAAGCDGGGGPISPPFDPFGADPATTTGSEPTNDDDEGPSAGGSIMQLCARACAHFASACGGSASGPDCEADCSRGSPAGCELEFRAAVACLGSAPLVCNGGSAEAPACDEVLRRFGTCSSN